MDTTSLTLIGSIFTVLLIEIAYRLFQRNNGNEIQKLDAEGKKNTISTIIIIRIISVLFIIGTFLAQQRWIEQEYQSKPEKIKTVEVIKTVVVKTDGIADEQSSKTCGLSEYQVNELNQATHLKHTDIEWCNTKKVLTTVTGFPSGLSQLKNLEELVVSSDNIPESIGNLTNLKYLGLGGGRLHHIPGSIGNLKSLDTLHLEYNQITELPESIGNLSSLRYLGLAHNQIKTLPSSVSKLINLRKIDLSENQLEIIPESIVELSTLENLILNKNAIRSFPNGIVNLRSLKELNLKDNPLGDFAQRFQDGGGPSASGTNMPLGGQKLTIESSKAQYIPITIRIDQDW